jgi:hypothetical protein
MNDAEKLFRKRREIGKAIWLLSLYWSLQDTDGCTWAWVKGGTPIDDDDVASCFQVSVFTAARWREKLRCAGMIQTFRREHGFSVFAYRPTFASKFLEYLDESPSSSSPWPKLATRTVQ